MVAQNSSRMKACIEKETFLTIQQLLSKYIKVSKYIKDHTEVKSSYIFHVNFNQIGLI